MDIESRMAEMAQKSMVARYTTLACFVWLIYDWLSTLDEEISFIWLKKRSFSKYLYFATRYFGVFFLGFEMISETRGWITDYCMSYYYVVGIATTVLLYIVEIGMQFRVYALYNCSKRILVVNGTLFLIEVLAISTLVGLDLHTRAKPMSTPTAGALPLTGCWNSERPHFTFANWVIALCYELYLFILIAYKAWGKYAQLGAFVGIFKLMFRDAVAWFVFIAALIGWNAFSWLGGSDGYVFLGLPFLHAGACIGGSRLLLNLGKAYYVTKNESWICAGGSGAIMKTATPHPCQAHEMQSIGGTKSPRTFVSQRPTNLNQPPPSLTSHEKQPLPSGAVRAGGLSPIYSTSYPFSYHHMKTANNNLKTPGAENALQIDLGFGQEKRRDKLSPHPSPYFSYADAWAESIPRIWDDRDEDLESWPTKVSGRANGAARDHILRSRSPSRSRSSIWRQ